MRMALIAAATLLPAAATAQQAIVLRPGEVLLEVQAVGEVRSAPDEATIGAGVVTQAPTARAAIEANNVTMQRLVAAIRAAGIEGGALRTRELSVRPRYSRPPRRTDGRGDDPDDFAPRIVGYDASNRVAAELRDTARLPALLDAMTGAGANQIDGPNFALADPRPAGLLARQRAVAEARAQAETLAAAAGMRIARTLRISERGGSGRYLEQTGYDAPPNAEEITVTGSRVPVEVGEITTRAQVSIDYALVPR